MIKTNLALLDTNILLLFLVAQTDRSLLKTFKRVQNFDATDVTLLEEVLSKFDGLVSTPHVLAEVSNFLDQAPTYRRPELLEALRHYVHAHAERHTVATLLVERDEFGLLGLTDTGLGYLSREAVVVTTDFRLAGKIESLGGNVINFNHARSAILLS